MIGKIAETIMKFIIAALTSLVNFVKDAFSTLFEWLRNLFIWLGQLLQRLFQALLDVLFAFFKVIYDLIYCLLYLIYKIGVLAVKLFQFLWEIGKLALAFIKGLFRTVASMFYTPTNGAGHGYSQPMGKVMQNLDVFQLDVVAVILMFIIWIFTAFAAIKILSTLKNV